jgi:uncharacterized protein (DUF2062 family)
VKPNGPQSSRFGEFWRRRVTGPIVQQLRQGITPEQVALTLALGGVLGVFPILGATTFLCAVVGVRLGLNQPLIQLVNYLVYPVQIVLLIPFYRAGEWLFRSPPVPILDVADLAARFRAGPWQFVLDYGRVGLYGVAVWLLVAPAVAAIAYFTLKPVLAAARRPR